MNGARKTTEGDGIISLVKETADGMGRLIADHIKLARLELVSDVKATVRQSLVLAVMAVFIFLGYALACVGLSLVLARWLGTSNAFFAVAGFHLVVGVAGLMVGVRKLSRSHLMDDTFNEVSRSVTTLSGATANGAGKPARDLHREGSRA